MFLVWRKKRLGRGMTLIDVLIGVALYVFIFLGLFAGIRLAISIIATNKAKTGALALATEQLELIRSIPYDSLGTQGGIPSGTLPQTATTTLNATKYTIRTLIVYVDQPQDGLGVADTNGITADAKKVKVELSWDDRAQLKSLALVSIVSPQGIESVAGGGTLRINVFDAAAQPIPSAQVRVQNDTLVPPVDVTTFTNTAGVVLFPGAAAAGSYKVTVTKSGYSTDKTYDADATNPNPTPGHLTVALAQTTNASFFIDTLGSLVVKTFSPIEPGSFDDTFDTSSNLKTLAGVVVSGGKLELGDDGGGGFVLSGTALSTTTAPTYLSEWSEATFSDTTNASTSLRVRVMSVDGSGNATEVPDVVLPGNSSGFSTSPISLASVSTTTYPRLALHATLASIDSAHSPAVLDWRIAFERGPIPLPNIPFAIQGAKTIGTTGGGAPIYKYDSSHTTNASGVVTLSGMEWDSYALSINPSTTGLVVMESCTPQPVSLAPGALVSNNFTLTPQTTNTLLLALKNNVGALLANTPVTISRTGFSQTATSTSCGQVFFGSLSSATYDIAATSTGYQVATTSLPVSGVTTDALIFSP